MPVFDPMLLAMHHEQARSVAPVGRLLRDQPVRQRVVEEIGLQGEQV
jgi:hypothetical protein